MSLMRPLRRLRYSGDLIMLFFYLCTLIARHSFVVHHSRRRIHTACITLFYKKTKLLLRPDFS